MIHPPVESLCHHGEAHGDDHGLRDRVNVLQAGDLMLISRIRSYT
jgi:hypothetical protein